MKLIPQTRESQPRRRVPRVGVYVAVLMVASATIVGLLVAAGYSVQQVWLVCGLGAAAAVAERWSVSFTATTQLSVYLLPTVFAAVVLGPLEAGIVAACSLLLDPGLISRATSQEAPRLRWAAYTCISFIAGAAAGVAAQAFGGIETVGSIVASTFAAMAVAETLDLTFVAVTAQVRGKRMRRVVSDVAPVALTSFLVYSPVVVLLVMAYSRVSAWALLMLLLPALAIQRLYGLYQRERGLTERLTEANQTLARVNLSFAEALVATLDARDRYTAGHSAAVAIYSRDIARRMGLASTLQERVYLCGLVHDIGKIGLPPGLLEKPGALTLEERRMMQEHSAIGERILRNVDGYDDIAEVVRHHHERIDGEGYPDGISDEAIPLLARIISVADAYNAMTSDRPYRDAMPSRVARMRLAQACGSQFDGAVVAAFDSVLSDEDESYRMARRQEFRFFVTTDAQREELTADSVPGRAVALGAA
jgi:putative nucleotidyltransferase with HDIG domain